MIKSKEGKKEERCKEREKKRKKERKKERKKKERELYVENKRERIEWSESGLMNLEQGEQIVIFEARVTVD